MWTLTHSLPTEAQTFLAHERHHKWQTALVAITLPLLVAVNVTAVTLSLLAF